MYTKLQNREYIIENAHNAKDFIRSSPSKNKRNILPSKKVEVVDGSDEETIASEHTHFNDQNLIGDDPSIVDESKNKQTRKRNGKYKRLYEMRIYDFFKTIIHLMIWMLI